ncbi:MAG TPA: hypothetical protein VFT87_05610 [Candidatus Saccharimonadales bacterium]|nr:hypothetical protein [Candidatus Saccharimonadales bacterium]
MRVEKGMTKTTITINGRLYDAITGMPAAGPAHLPAKKTTQPTKAASRQFNDIVPNKAAQVNRSEVAPSRAMHQHPQRSQTLNRQAIKKPAQKQHEHQPKHEEPTRSPLISHFAEADAAATTQPNPPQEQQHAPQPDHLIPPHTTPLHPSAIKAMQQSAMQAAPKAALYQSSKQLKEQLIKERLAEVSTEKPPKKSFFARRPRMASVLASTLSLLILGGYFTYINLSNISMRVASTRAGVNAEFPNYQPSGYGISGPITYAPGEVSIHYKSNTNDNGFTLTQKTANWDSQAVLDNYVRKQSNTYLTFQERGITVYTFNNKAAWANGGLFYTVEGDANLSSEQVLRLASSL